MFTNALSRYFWKFTLNTLHRFRSNIRLFIMTIGLNNAAVRRIALFADYLNKIVTIDFVRVDNVRHLMSDGDNTIITIGISADVFTSSCSRSICPIHVRRTYRFADQYFLRQRLLLTPPMASGQLLIIVYQ